MFRMYNFELRRVDELLNLIASVSLELAATETPKRFLLALARWRARPGRSINF